MDALDVGIVRELGIMPFAVWPHAPEGLRPSALAKRFGVSIDAVKDRIRRLESEGVLKGSEIYPNFRHFGLDVTSYRFRLPDEGKRARATRDAETVDGVFSVTAFMGSDVCVDICHTDPTELQRRMSLLSRLMDDAAPRSFFGYALPPVARALSPLDWRIIQALRGHARRSLDEVAEAVGVSARTVKRRFDRMAKEGAFDIVAVFDPGALRGYTFFLLMASLRAPAGEREVRAVLSAFADRWFVSWTPPGVSEASLYIALLAPSVGEVEALRREAETISCVTRAECLIPVDLRTNGVWIDRMIAERAAIRTRAAPPPVVRHGEEAAAPHPPAPRSDGRP